MKTPTAVQEVTASLPATSEQFAQFTRSWLDNRRLSVHTREAYARDVAGWLSWCATADLSPLMAKFTHVNAFARDLEKTLAPSTVARKMSAVSSWYSFMIKVGLLTVNPADGADRPQVDRDDSATVGMSPAEVDLLLKTAAKRSLPRDYALLVLLADLGLRISEALALDVEHIGRHAGRRVLLIVTKGGRRRRRPLAGPTAVILDRYLAQRAADERIDVTELSGPLFTTASGARLARSNASLMLTRIARRAGLPNAEQISPHSFRHAFATTARMEGVPLEAVQDALGHLDPRTTRRYDRERFSLDDDPTHRLAARRVRRMAV